MALREKGDIVLLKGWGGVIGEFYSCVLKRGNGTTFDHVVLAFPNDLNIMDVDTSHQTYSDVAIKDVEVLSAKKVWEILTLMFSKNQKARVLYAKGTIEEAFEKTPLLSIANSNINELLQNNRHGS